MRWIPSYFSLPPQFIDTSREGVERNPEKADEGSSRPSREKRQLTCQGGNKGVEIKRAERKDTSVVGNYSAGGGETRYIKDGGRET